jgi:hypothetical protein
MLAQHEHKLDACMYSIELQLTLCSKKACSKAARRSDATVWSPHSGILKVLAMYIGRCPPTTTQGVTDLSTDARSDKTHACCSLPASVRGQKGEDCRASSVSTHKTHNNSMLTRRIAHHAELAQPASYMGKTTNHSMFDQSNDVTVCYLTLLFISQRHPLTTQAPISSM